MLPLFAAIAIFGQLDTFWTVVWSGLGLGTIGLVIALVRYRRAEPIHNCIVLSVWAHVLLAVYAGSVRVVVQPGGPGRETMVHLDFVEGSPAEPPQADELVEPRDPPPVVEPHEPSQADPQQPPAPTKSEPATTVAEHSDDS
ncbi:MAG TPA: hypothetical protein VG713_17085, partial [Pirellulales bacterium]|nr:hypothetical protein [Pirellulales bacterium]